MGSVYAPSSSSSDGPITRHCQLPAESPTAGRNVSIRPRLSFGGSRGGAPNSSPERPRYMGKHMVSSPLRRADLHLRRLPATQDQARLGSTWRSATHDRCGKNGRHLRRNGFLPRRHRHIQDRARRAISTPTTHLWQDMLMDRATLLDLRMVRITIRVFSLRLRRDKNPTADHITGNACSALR